MSETAHFLGVNGLTIGGAGIWTLVVLALGAALRQWIAGIADRKRADNEGMSVTEKLEQDARTMVFDQMQKQMARMETEIDGLKKRVVHLEEQVKESVERERKLLEENTLLRIASAVKAQPKPRTKTSAQQ